jgi:hypothetical protein
LGTGTTPTNDTVDPATTFTQAGTTVTLSGGTYNFTDTGTDAGKTIVWLDGTPGFVTARIVTVTSPTVCEVNTNVSQAGAAVHVYRTNQVGLTTEVVRTDDYLTDSGDCETVKSGATVTHKRTFIFPAEAAPITYTELGISQTAAVGNNLFSRILLPVPVYLAATQQLKVAYSLQITVSPATPNAKTANVVGWPVAPSVTTDGEEQIQYYGLAVVHESGATLIPSIDGVANEPGAVGNQSEIFLSTVSTAPATIGSAVDRTGTGSVTNTTSISDYTPLSFTRDKYVVFDVSEGNRSDWRSFGLVRNLGTLDHNSYVFVFDEDQTKDSSHTLELRITFSWGMDFS